MITETPFPHKFQKSIFPSVVWLGLNNGWPNSHMFTPYSDGKDREIGDPGRFGFYILGHARRNYLDQLAPVEAKFWEEFVSKELKSIIFQEYICYLPYLRARFKGDMSKVRFQVFAILVDCYKELEVLVHTENPSVVITGLVYRNSQRASGQGTAFYLPKKNGFIHEGAGFLGFEGFDELNAFPFEDNCQLSFLKTGNSFHGVPKTSIENSNNRSTINWHIRLTDDSLRNLYGVDSYWKLGEGNCSSKEYFLNEIESWRDRSLKVPCIPSTFELKLFNDMFDSAEC